MIYSRSVCTINVAAIECMAKKNLLRDFINENDIDVCFLQEVVFTDFDIFYGYDVLVNIGSAARGTAVLIRNGIEYRDFLLSECGRIISFVLDDTVFVNVYPISGSQYNRERRDFFLNEIVPHFNKPNVRQTIIGGDFNCIIDPADTRGATKNLCYELKRLTESMELRDVYTKFFHNFANRQYTFHRGNSASRLDRLYVSNLIFSKSLEFRVLPTCFSDHCAVLLKYEIDSSGLAARCGRGYWKINPMLLNNREIGDRFGRSCDLLRQRSSYNTDLSKWWSMDFKRNSMNFYKSEIIAFNRECSRRKDFFYGLLRELVTRLNDGETPTVDIGYVKRELCEIERQKLNALGYKMKTNVLCEDERLNLFHFVKQKKEKNNVKELQIGETTTRDNTAIKNHIEGFYQQLLSGQEQVSNTNNTLNLITARVDQNFSDGLSQPISLEEIESTLKSCTKKRALARTD